MALYQSPKISTDGLVFYYDMNNVSKSFKGKPTTNFVYTQNARTDSSYASYSATSAGTWNAKHPDAIRVYNDDGSEITGYVNTGVTDWTNTYHAIWTLDPILQRPVVTMRDVDGQWKAKSWGLGETYTSMGLGAGSTYTISWLSWTSDITKCANAGIYSPNSGGSYNFWDGQSNSYGTAYNTLPNTWQRVYATFTVASGLNYTAGLSIYMYGHYGNRGTVKIADVQVETGVPSAFSKEKTRSASSSVLDLVSNYTLTPNNIVYNSNGSFSFNNSWFDLNSGNIITGNNPFTVESWYTTTGSTADEIFGNYGSGSTSGTLWISGRYGTYISGAVYFPGAPLGAGTYHLATTRDAAGNVVLYKNGEQVNSGVLGSSIPVTYNFRIGADVNGGAEPFTGSIYSVKVYNRVLSAEEIKQNFNSQRGRYGL